MIADLKIGDVAKQTQVAVGALRYYEDQGLIHSERGDNGYRYYSPDIVQQVLFIKKAQSLGLSLGEIREILMVHRRGDLPCEFVQHLLQEKIQQLEVKIQEMILFKTELEAYRDRWSRDQIRPQPADICPLINMVPLTQVSDQKIGVTKM